MRRMMLIWQLIAHDGLFFLVSRIRGGVLLLRNETESKILVGM